MAKQAQACIFGKASLVFRQTIFWNQMGVLYKTESFLTAFISLVHEPDKPWSYTNSRKELRRNCSPIRHNINTKYFLCPIRRQHLLEFLEIVRWESVPRGSFARTWKLSSRLFSRPDWLPLGLRGWHHVYVKRQTQICTTWPRFPFACRLLFIISTHKLVVSRNFLSIGIGLSCFYLLIFYFEKSSTWIWRLPFAVCRIREA